MTRFLTSLSEVASDYGAIVLDQWGVLHDGCAPYPLAVSTLSKLKDQGHVLAVLSNSGKRAAPNAARLTRMGYPSRLFDLVMTSGEALWRAFDAGKMPFSKLFPIARAPGDAEDWAKGLDVSFAAIEQAEAVLLMGLPDGSPPDAFEDVLAVALDLGLPVLCSNPDRRAPRAAGTTVLSPGSLADRYTASGGEVRFVGKPHCPVFRAVEAALDLPPGKFLMVGDSLEHDIAGADAAGWHGLFIRGGLYAEKFAGGRIEETLSELVQIQGTPKPDYTLDTLG